MQYLSDEESGEWNALIIQFKHPEPTLVHTCEAILLHCKQ